MQHFDLGESQYRAEKLQNTPTDRGRGGVPWWIVVPGYLVANFIALAVFPPLSVVVSTIFVVWLLRRIILWWQSSSAK